jgi:cysteine synthase
MAFIASNLSRVLVPRSAPSRAAVAARPWLSMASGNPTFNASANNHGSFSLQSRDLNVAARPSDLVGHTPLLDLTPILHKHNIDNGCKLYGKMESMEPCSSVKDRLGKSMIDAAEAAGQLVPGKSVLVEPTSGNTGIALAFIARERGYRCILTMPETMSIERRMMLLALGAEVVLTPKETAVPGALAKAKEILESLNGNGVMLQQFENPNNPKVHRETTGPEIWEDTDGIIDIFVSGVGTGGTLTGVSQYIKGSKEFGLEPKNAKLITIGVEPQEQMLLTAAKGGEKIGEQGPHKIQGMGAGLVPPILDLDLIDEVVPVHSEKAMETTNELWQMGIPVGVSSGAIVNASIQVCGRDESKNKVAVCIIPSFGERYFTHPMFDPIKTKAEGLTKQPLPPPFDNRDFGFATERGE